MSEIDQILSRRNLSLTRFARSIATSESTPGVSHPEGDKESIAFDSQLFERLSPQLQVQSKSEEHLWSYLCDLPVDHIGVPAYYSGLSRQHIIAVADAATVMSGTFFE